LLLRTVRLAPEFGIGIFDEALQFIALLHLQIAFPQALVLPLDLCRRPARLISRVCSHSDFTILSMADIDRVCVELFPLSGTRRPIMDGLE
jgi:hypothetical protein